VTPEIRRIRDEELPAFVDAMTTAFHERPDVDRVADEMRAVWDLQRTWGAFDGDRICGTFRSWPTEVTVPGGALLAAAAVAGVTVLPTHRRQGILRRMVAVEHAAIRERGEAIGLLHASEYPIYGRFGYGAGCRDATWTLDTRGSAFHGEPTGGVDLVKPSEATRDTLKVVFDAWRRRQPGEIRRRDVIWDYDLGLRLSAFGDDWKGFVALHRDASGAVDGYARYRTEERWERRQPRQVLTVDELHGLTDQASLALWRFLADVDWVATVKAERRRPGDPLPWLLTNARAASVSDVGDALWVRLFDVPRALEARTYDGEGSVVLELLDPEAPGGRTRIHLDAGPDGATACRTDRSPDLTLDIAALGAAYFGGARLRDAVLARGVDEHRAGALLAADRLLRTLDEPWCSTFF
jgi:predicted acetyltransferase